MQTTAQQFITDNQGNRLSIVLPIDYYNKLLQAWEELEDIKAYDESKARKREFIPAEKAFKDIEKKRQAANV